jgi:hypothetical protein
MNRFILTEEERQNISNLHKKFVNEEDAQATSIKPGVFNQKVQELQNHLISLGHKIVADGKLGPKTLAAAQTSLQTKMTQSTTNTATATNTTNEIPSLAPKSLTDLNLGVQTPNLIQPAKVNNPSTDDSEPEPEYWGKNGPIQQN